VQAHAAGLSKRALAEQRPHCLLRWRARRRSRRTAHAKAACSYVSFKGCQRNPQKTVGLGAGEKSTREKSTSRRQSRQLVFSLAAPRPALPGRLLFGHLIRPGLRRDVASIHAFAGLPVHVFATLTGAGCPCRNAKRDGDCGKRHTQLNYAHRFLHFCHFWRPACRPGRPRAARGWRFPQRCPSLSCDRPLTLETRYLLRVTRTVTAHHPTNAPVAQRALLHSSRRVLRPSRRQARTRRRTSTPISIRASTSSWLRLSIPQAGVLYVKSNGGAGANRCVSHARVKRSDQSCTLRDSQNRFVRLDRRHRLLQRCREG